MTAICPPTVRRETPETANREPHGEGWAIGPEESETTMPAGEYQMDVIRVALAPMVLKWSYTLREWR